MRSYNVTLDELIDQYDAVGLKTRNMKFLAKWFCDMYDFSYLPSIDLSYKDQLVIDKLKLSIFNIMVDDLADNYKIRNKELFEKAVRIPWNEKTIFKNRYLTLIKKIWLDFEESMKKYPRYEEFKDMFYFDLDQFLDSIKYSMLINSVAIDNPLEIRTYSPQNMQVILFLDMDLMCSPDFDKAELGKLRPVLLWTQDLLHLAHVLNTYPREIQELDYSSPMISIGINEGVIDREDVIRNPEKTLENLKYFEPYLKNLAEEEFEKIKDQSTKIESVDIDDFYRRVRKVYNYFLDRPQYWELSRMHRKKINEAFLQTYKQSARWVRM